MSKPAFDSRAIQRSEDVTTISATDNNPAWLALVAEKVSGLNYGVVQIVVHDSRVVQVERTERHRFDVHH